MKVRVASFISLDMGFVAIGETVDVEFFMKAVYNFKADEK